MFLAVCRRKRKKVFLVADGTVEWLDGVSISLYDWHFNGRPSNAAPLLCLNLEAKSKELMEEKWDQILGIMGEAGKTV